MKILLIGTDGQLGTDLTKELRDYNLFTPSLKKLNIIDFRKTKNYISSINPDIVINTAAYHDVAKCERNYRRSFRVNSFATKNLAEICRKMDTNLIFISTNYVFDGEKKTAYLETDLPNPVNIYGQSKYLGEQFIKTICKKYFIVRTAALFGKAGCKAKGRGNFVKTMLNLANKEVRVKDNEYTSITYTKDLAKAIRQMMFKGKYGIYHLVNQGKLSWYDFAKEIYKLSNLKVNLKPTYEVSSKGVRRPKNGTLKTNKNIILPKWENALKRYLYEIS